MTFSKQVLLALAPALASGSYASALRGKKPGPYQRPETKSSDDDTADWTALESEVSAPQPADDFPTIEKAREMEQAAERRAQAAKAGWDLVDGEIPAHGWKSIF